MLCYSISGTYSSCTPDVLPYPSTVTPSFPSPSPLVTTIPLCFYFYGFGYFRVIHMRSYTIFCVRLISLKPMSWLPILCVCFISLSLISSKIPVASPFPGHLRWGGSRWKVPAGCGGQRAMCLVWLGQGSSPQAQLLRPCKMSPFQMWLHCGRWLSHTRVRKPALP